MGGLNQGVIRAALELPREEPSRSGGNSLSSGKKGPACWPTRGGSSSSSPGINQDTIYEQAVAIKDHIVAEVLALKMGKVSAGISHSPSRSVRRRLENHQPLALR